MDNDEIYRVTVRQTVGEEITLGEAEEPEGIFKELDQLNREFENKIRPPHFWEHPKLQSIPPRFLKLIAVGSLFVSVISIHSLGSIVLDIILAGQSSMLDQTIFGGYILLPLSVFPGVLFLYALRTYTPRYLNSNEIIYILKYINTIAVVDLKNSYSPNNSEIIIKSLTQTENYIEIKNGRLIGFKKRELNTTLEKTAKKTGDILYDRGQYEKALTSYNIALNCLTSNSSDNIEQQITAILNHHVTTARDAIQNDNHEIAIKNARSVIKYISDNRLNTKLRTNTEFSQVVNELGNLMLESGEYQMAIECYEIVQETKWIREELSDFEQNIVDCHIAIMNRKIQAGELETANGNYETAAENFRSAIDYVPDFNTEDELLQETLHQAEKGYIDSHLQIFKRRLDDAIDDFEAGEYDIAKHKFESTVSQIESGFDVNFHSDIQQCREQIETVKNRAQGGRIEAEIQLGRQLFETAADYFEQEAYNEAEQQFNNALELFMRLEYVNIDCVSEGIKTARRGLLRCRIERLREQFSDAATQFEEENYREGRNQFLAIREDLETLQSQVDRHNLADEEAAIESLLTDCEMAVGAARRAIADIERGTVDTDIASFGDDSTVTSRDDVLGGIEVSFDPEEVSVSAEDINEYDTDDPDEAGAGDREVGTSSHPDNEPDEFRTVMRLLGNREFPVDRGGIVELAASAYELEESQVDQCLDYAVDRGVIDDDGGTLRRG